MFRTNLGPVETPENVVYLRPETAQAMFVDFKQIVEAYRMKVPFGIAQIGKAFRNEITPRNFIFRTREFEQMEIEYFVRAQDWKDPETGEKFIPHVIEPSLGVERTVLAVLFSAYEEVKGGRTTTTESVKEEEVVLHLPKAIAPIKVAVLPLSRKTELTEPARAIYRELRTHFMCEYDETASVGKRYRRQDEIGTPYCVTFDFESIDDTKVTVRDRDSMKQDRVAIAELSGWLKEKFEL